MTASETTKAQGPFVSPECTKAVIVRKCRTKVDHFAHLPPVTCQYGAGETELHRKCKTQIFEALRACPHVTKLELERCFRLSMLISGAPFSGAGFLS